MITIKANGAEMPALGFGTWTLKGDQCADMVQHALAVGYRHVDTARIYDNEIAVGEGIRAAKVEREKLFVTTKVWWTDIGSGDLERSAQASLKRLGLDYVDLLLIHWPNPDIPVKTSMKALNAARASGMTRHIGVSNFTTTLLKQAIESSDAPLVANQVEYHPYLDQTKVYDLCRGDDISMVAYCPIYRGGPLFEESVVKSAASNHGKTPAQIVLRWQVQQDGVAAIPRTTKKERLLENFQIFDFSLTIPEMTAISALKIANRRIGNFDFSPIWDTV